ncbi:MAG: GSCFA domain-containing protein [Candidatus Symbiothrix sp.]|nr:GSCFA domain-containing protein [Candidatus Symbiothrix sp.]
MMMGSCFVENMAGKIVRAGFQTDVNPFGIVYNPVSLANGLYDLINRTVYSEDALFEHQGVYHSFRHHSRFSGLNQELVLEQINDRIRQSSHFLKEANRFVLTFGTARVYRLISSGEVVANCHKLPANRFREERLDVEQIVLLWNELIQCLQALNPGMQLLFTVSPIRHGKDGAHENQLNKAVLLLAIDALIKTNEGCYYFPSYELMMDDLRDYRFYAEDMVHPGLPAVDYIWEKFGEACFDASTRKIIQEWENIQLALNHRPFNPESEEYKRFLSLANEKKERFIRQFGAGVKNE